MFLRLFSNLWNLLIMGLAVGAAWWTYNDAKWRGLISWLWALVSLFLFPLGFIIYLIVRTFFRPKSTT